MAGYELKEGMLSLEKLNIHDYLSIIISFINNKKDKRTSYKYALFKSILDNLFNSNSLYISFDELCYTFSKIYWNIVVKYKLKQITPSAQWKSSSMEAHILKFIEDNPLLDGIDFDSLNDVIKNKYISNVEKIAFKYVIGALYQEFFGKIYGFSKEKGFIWLSNESYEFLTMNKVLLEKLNYFAWVEWLESALDKWDLSEGNITKKLDQSTQREDLSKFKMELLQNGDDLKCFYCDRNLSGEKIHVDHFVPWSFVKSDNIWNLVISCPKCNLKKNDKIPTENYLDKILSRNEDILGDSHKEQIIKLYKSALYNGFSEWKNLKNN